MKKKLLALVCALALTVSLVGCVFSTPDTVGKIGDFEVTSGLYLLAQYDAYQQAAQLAGSEQDASKVKSFLKATITTDADTGETAVVKDYVAQKTLETLQTLAAVDARFAELGGELTEEQKSAADSYAQQLMDNYGDAYTANGIGLETLKLFQQLQYKQTLLLDLVYGKDGETPVEDGELTEHLDSQMYELAYVNIPLYNTSTFVSASDDQKAQMLTLAQQAAMAVNLAANESASEQVSALNAAAQAALPDIYAVLGSTPSDTNVQTELLGASTLDSTFTQDGAADTIRSLAYRAVFQLRHDACSASGPAGRGLAGRRPHPGAPRSAEHPAQGRPCRLRRFHGAQPQRLRHEEAAHDQDREQIKIIQTQQRPAGESSSSGALFLLYFAVTRANSAASAALQERTAEASGLSAVRS